jgi:hypothetical protein
MLSSPQKEIYNSVKERILFLSGVASGKTFILGLRAMKYVKFFPEIIGLICSNTYQQLSKSTLKRCFQTWKDEFNLTNGIHYVVDKIPPANWPKFHEKLKSYENTICFNNGCVIFTFSLDNYKAIDGTEVGWCELDETKDSKEEAIKETVVARLRQKGMYISPQERFLNQMAVDTAIKNGDFLIERENDLDKIIDRRTKREILSRNPLAIFTSPAKVLWLNEWFGMPDYYEEINQKIFSKTGYFSRETDRQKVIICSTYHNEANLPNGFINNLLADYKGNPHLVDMLIYGSPIAKTGGEFYHQFDRMKHLGETDYDEDIPIHVSFDFNVVPYISATISQIYLSDGIYYVETQREYALSAPHNNSEDLSNRILLDFQNHKGGCFIYGDASGANRQTVSKTHKHNYSVIESILKPLLHPNSNRVTKRNPPLIKRRDFANKLFAEGYPIRQIIDPSCKHLITDFEFIKEAPDGGKLKEKVKDSNTGETYEKLGHMCDNWDYLVCAAFDMYFSPK